MAFVRSVMPPRVNGTIRLVDNSIVAIAGPQRDFAVVDFFALVAPTDPLGFGVRLSWHVVLNQKLFRALRTGATGHQEFVHDRANDQGASTVRAGDVQFR